MPLWTALSEEASEGVTASAGVAGGEVSLATPSTDLVGGPPGVRFSPSGGDSRASVVTVPGQRGHGLRRGANPPTATSEPRLDAGKYVGAGRLDPRSQRVVRAHLADDTLERSDFARLIQPPQMAVKRPVLEHQPIRRDRTSGSPSARGHRPPPHARPWVWLRGRDQGRCCGPGCQRRPSVPIAASTPLWPPPRPRST